MVGDVPAVQLNSAGLVTASLVFKTGHESKVGDQRVAMSTFPIAPFQTTHDRFCVTSLSSERFRGGQPRIMATLVTAFRISRTSQALTGFTCATSPCKRLSRLPRWGVTPTTTIGTPSP